MQEDTLITAHSGADGTAENSLAYARHALSTAADAFEVDVRRALSGELALGHDATNTASPTLRQIFALLAEHPSMKINCDLKEAGLERDTVQLAIQHGLAGRLILTGTVNPRSLAADDTLRQAAEVYWNAEECVPGLYRRDRPVFTQQTLDAICQTCVQQDIRVLNIYHGIVDERVLAFFAKKGLGVSVWTVNKAEQLAWFLQRGVRNITTRQPVLAVSLREKQRFQRTD